MIITNLPAEFEEAKEVLGAIQQAGFEAYFVGGSVRDTILGLKIHDVDIATSAYPAEVKKIFKKTIDTGIEHGTVTVLDHNRAYEITTFRTESTYQDFRRPDHVKFVRSLREDLKRRDLTINALAMKPDGEIIDLFDGLNDLKEGNIRAVGVAEERFHEDALRMMRAVRFASQLDFTIEKNTLDAIKHNAHLLQNVAVERIHVEWAKLLLGTNPKTGLENFLATTLYYYCPLFKDKEEVFRKILRLRGSVQLSSEASAWTLICYLSSLTSTAVKKMLRAWKSSNELVDSVVIATEIVSLIERRKLDTWSYYKGGLHCIKFANEVASILGFGINHTTLEENYAALPIKNKHELKINGGVLISQLKIKPGPQLGKILEKIEYKVVMGEIENQPTALLKAVSSWIEAE
ncbi:cca-adding enzyme (trna nucleotidyltransferase) [Liquorilactobacillus aquaticus DSM 21051]|uniref:CCA-adding enzyme n=1 Tax=Liquorilactobacillus aquaticus DSM 21051 TaxID=1423725 RepID=A0A0R2CWU4_9LACO|nr:CCA tRNA nucleotidyltransferase [Liquorilactobacillus aquaticus]KRM96333.1 cca-adding enzyme (trna nucleotidyltransferase) [Liquorilactobacillus aquaticus DSM 21051]